MTTYRNLDRYLNELTTTNARVLSRADSWAVVVKGRPVNHVRHLLLSIVTCTMWAPVWLLMVAFAGERRFVVSSAGSAGIIEQPQPRELDRAAALACAVVWGLCISSAFGQRPPRR